MESIPVLSSGEKVHIVVRRLFEDDLRRHFVGEVVALKDGRLRVEGYAFVFDTLQNQFVRRPELRTRVLSLDSHLLVNVLPKSVVVADLVYRMAGKSLVVTDSKGLSLEINEFGPNR